MGRRHLWRRVTSVPQVTEFRPVDTRAADLEEVRLLVEEAEAIRLNDLEGLDQEECARRMSVSRSTFSRILDSARHKIADALLNGKGIRIEGGNYEMAVRRFRCVSGHEWEVPFERLIAGPPEACPRCDTPSVMPLFPPGMGRGGWRHGRGPHR